eukprot:2411538-Prymnesium_polylepis.1
MHVRTGITSDRTTGSATPQGPDRVRLQTKAATLWLSPRHNPPGQSARPPLRWSAALAVAASVARHDGWPAC